MSLDYPELVKKSLKNAWEHKFLWLFGFFVAGADYSGMFNWVTNIPSRRRYSRHFDFDIDRLSDLDEIMPFGWGLETILMLMGAAFLLWLFLFVMSFLSEGALIHGISRKQLGTQVSFGECWAKGIDRFWRVLGILVLLGLAVGFSVLFIILMLVPMYIVSVGLGVVLTIVAAIPVFLVLIFVTESIGAWGIRLAVLDDVPCIESLGKGWQMLRDNVGKSFGVGLSSTLVQIVSVILVLICAAVFIVPFLLISHAAPIAALVTIAPLALAAIVITSIFLGMFKSSIWTLAYMQITGKITSLTSATQETGPPLEDKDDSAGPA